MPSNPANVSDLSVKTIDADGKAPKRRMGSATAVWQQYQQMKQYNVRRDARFADIESINLGMPPVAQVTNEQNGQSDLPNINTKQFQAKVNTYVSTWTAINAQGDGFAEIKLYHEDAMKAEEWSKIVTEEFNYAIRQWEMMDENDFQCGNQYVLECAARDTQMGLYGLGVSYFRDQIDFRFRMIPTRQVLVPDGTRLGLENCSAMFIEDQMSVTELYQMREKKGWNKEAILKALYDHVEQLSKSQARQYSFAEWVEQIRNNDSWLLSDFLPVRVIYSFVREFDGSITQSAITDIYDTSGRNKASDEEAETKGFLYDRPNAAKRWSQIIIPFADNAGPECTWHGVKGFGDMIFDGCHLNNQQFNAAAKAGIIQNLMMFEGEGENDSQKMEQITLSPLGILPAGLRLQQTPFKGDIDGALAVFGMGSQIMAENTRISPPNEKTVTREQPTATQVTADRADRAQLTTLQIAIYRAVGQDPLFGEMYRRIAQPNYPEVWGGGLVAKRFRENCKRRGVPTDALLKVCYVRANRNIGSGDLALDLMKADQLMSVATPGRGQMNARREKVIALKGPDMASAFIEEQPEPTPQDQQISNENSIIQSGIAPTAFGFDDQELHVTSHMALLGQAGQVAAQVQERGLTPGDVEGAKKLTNVISAGISHVGQHLQLMMQIPRVGKMPSMYEQIIAQTTKALNDLNKLNEGLTEEVAKLDQTQQPQMTPEMIKAQTDAQIKVAMAQLDMQLKTQAHQAKLGNMAVQAEARTELKGMAEQQRIADEAERSRQTRMEEAAKTSQEMILKGAEAEQDLAIKAAEGEQAVEQKKKEAAAKPKTTKTK